MGRKAILEEAAKACEYLYKKTIYTEHYDGLGMGNSQKEKGIKEAIKIIRELK